ncbi:hypothetical protein Hanom_Chr03g00262661 [Helianthus anomalus]
MSTDDQRPELQNGDANPEPDSDLNTPEHTTIQSTDNVEDNSSPIQSSDNDKSPQVVDPEPATQVSDTQNPIESKDNEQLQKDEGNRTFTMRELLNELKNGDGDQESQVSAGTDAVTPRRRLAFSPDLVFVLMTGVSLRRLRLGVIEQELT